MSQNLPINFTVGAFPVGFKGNCQDFANALVERLTGTVQLGSIFQAQYAGQQPSTDVGPWFKNGNSVYYFDYNTGQYQPAEDQTPIGACILWAGPGAPDRYLLCQGQGVSRVQFQRLFQRIGTQFGAGDGANTFNLPPGGRFIVGAGYDPLTGTTYYQGQVGGTVPQITIQPTNLPQLIVIAWGQPQHGGTGPGYSAGAPGDTNYNIWPVYSENAPVPGNKTPINIPPPSYVGFNICIRYT
jgi:microcystin-dependent protein